MRVPGTSRKPSSAALPVSPLVAVKTAIPSLTPSFSRDSDISRGRIDSATSLNALVGPRNNSSTWAPPTGASGAMSSVSNLPA